MQRVRVLLVDDSPVYLGIMQATIKADEDLFLAGCYSNGLKALEDIMQIQPNVVVCDLHMPHISGTDFIKQLSKKHRVPVVAISSNEHAAAEALSAGAVGFVPKLKNTFSGQTHFAAQVVESIYAAYPCAKTGCAQAEPDTKPVQKTVAAFNKPVRGVVAIGASTGGTDATLEVVKNLPADFPALLIIQHMPVGFTSLYVERLQRQCSMQVCEASDKMRVRQGLAILATGGEHLRLAQDEKGYYIHSCPGEKVSGHIPSVDAAFFSVAELAKANAIGVLLTGMGSDGAKGLLAMRKAGAFTFGQDRSTSVVYGMPKVAYDMGAVAKQMALQDIGAELLRLAHLRLI